MKIIAGNKKMIAGVGLEPNHVWAPCYETWLKFEIAGVKVAIAKKILKIRDFYLLGSYPLVGRHVVNASKVKCHVVNELEKSQVGLCSEHSLTFILGAFRL